MLNNFGSGETNRSHNGQEPASSQSQPYQSQSLPNVSGQPLHPALSVLPTRNYSTHTQIDEYYSNCIYQPKIFSGQRSANHNYKRNVPSDYPTDKRQYICYNSCCQTYPSPYSMNATATPSHIQFPFSRLNQQNSIPSNVAFQDQLMQNQQLQQCQQMDLHYLQSPANPIFNQRVNAVNSRETPSGIGSHYATSNYLHSLYNARPTFTPEHFERIPSKSQSSKASMKHQTSVIKNSNDFPYASDCSQKPMTPAPVNYAYNKRPESFLPSYLPSCSQPTFPAPNQYSSHRGPIIDANQYSHFNYPAPPATPSVDSKASQPETVKKSSSSKPPLNIDVRQFLATWDDDDDEPASAPVPESPSPVVSSANKSSQLTSNSGPQDNVAVLNPARNEHSVITADPEESYLFRILKRPERSSLNDNPYPNVEHYAYNQVQLNVANSPVETHVNASPVLHQPYAKPIPNYPAPPYPSDGLAYQVNKKCNKPDYNIDSKVVSPADKMSSSPCQYQSLPSDQNQSKTPSSSPKLTYLNLDQNVIKSSEAYSPNNHLKSTPRTRPVTPAVDYEFRDPEQFIKPTIINKADYMRKDKSEDVSHKPAPKTDTKRAGKTAKERNVSVVPPNIQYRDKVVKPPNAVPFSEPISQFHRSQTSYDKTTLMPYCIPTNNQLSNRPYEYPVMSVINSSQNYGKYDCGRPNYTPEEQKYDNSCSVNINLNITSDKSPQVFLNSVSAPNSSHVPCSKSTESSHPLTGSSPAKCITENPDPLCKPGSRKTDKRKGDSREPVFRTSNDKSSMSNAAIIHGKEIKSTSFNPDSIPEAFQIHSLIGAPKSNNQVAAVNYHTGNKDPKGAESNNSVPENMSAISHLDSWNKAIDYTNIGNSYKDRKSNYNPYCPPAEVALACPTNLAPESRENISNRSVFMGNSTRTSCLFETPYAGNSEVLRTGRHLTHFIGGEVPNPNVHNHTVSTNNQNELAKDSKDNNKSTNSKVLHTQYYKSCLYNSAPFKSNAPQVPPQEKTENITSSNLISQPTLDINSNSIDFKEKVNSNGDLTRMSSHRVEEETISKSSMESREQPHSDCTVKVSNPKELTRNDSCNVTNSVITSTLRASLDQNRELSKANQADDGPKNTDRPLVKELSHEKANSPVRAENTSPVEKGGKERQEELNFDDEETIDSIINERCDSFGPVEFPIESNPEVKKQSDRDDRISPLSLLQFPESSKSVSEDQTPDVLNLSQETVETPSEGSKIVEVQKKTKVVSGMADLLDSDNSDSNMTEQEELARTKNKSKVRSVSNDFSSFDLFSDNGSIFSDVSCSETRQKLSSSKSDSVTDNAAANDSYSLSSAVSESSQGGEGSKTDELTKTDNHTDFEILVQNEMNKFNFESDILNMGSLEVEPPQYFNEQNLVHEPKPVRSQATGNGERHSRSKLDQVKETCEASSDLNSCAESSLAQGEEKTIVKAEKKISAVRASESRDSLKKGSFSQEAKKGGKSTTRCSKDNSKKRKYSSKKNKMQLDSSSSTANVEPNAPKPCLSGSVFEFESVQSNENISANESCVNMPEVKQVSQEKNSEDPPSDEYVTLDLSNKVPKNERDSVLLKTELLEPKFPPATTYPSVIISEQTRNTAQPESESQSQLESNHPFISCIKSCSNDQSALISYEVTPKKKKKKKKKKRKSDPWIYSSEPSCSSAIICEGDGSSSFLSSSIESVEKQSTRPSSTESYPTQISGFDTSSRYGNHQSRNSESDSSALEAVPPIDLSTNDKCTLPPDREAVLSSSNYFKTSTSALSNQGSIEDETRNQHSNSLPVKLVKKIEISVSPPSDEDSNHSFDGKTEDRPVDYFKGSFLDSPKFSQGKFGKKFRNSLSQSSTDSIISSPSYENFLEDSRERFESRSTTPRFPFGKFGKRFRSNLSESSSASSVISRSSFLEKRNEDKRQRRGSRKNIKNRVLKHRYLLNDDSEFLGVISPAISPRISNNLETSQDNLDENQDEALESQKKLLSENDPFFFRKEKSTRNTRQLISPNKSKSDIDAYSDSDGLVEERRLEAISYNNSLDSVPDPVFEQFSAENNPSPVIGDIIYEHTDSPISCNQRDLQDSLSDENLDQEVEDCLEEARSIRTKINNPPESFTDPKITVETDDPVFSAPDSEIVEEISAENISSNEPTELNKELPPVPPVPPAPVKIVPPDTPISLGSLQSNLTENQEEDFLSDEQKLGNSHLKTSTSCINQGAVLPVDLTNSDLPSEESYLDASVAEGSSEKFDSTVQATPTPNFNAQETLNLNSFSSQVAECEVSDSNPELSENQKSEVLQSEIPKSAETYSQEFTQKWSSDSTSSSSDSVVVSHRKGKKKKKKEPNKLLLACLFLDRMEKKRKSKDQLSGLMSSSGNSVPEVSQNVEVENLSITVRSSVNSTTIFRRPNPESHSDSKTKLEISLPDDNYHEKLCESAENIANDELQACISVENVNDSDDQFKDVDRTKDPKEVLAINPGTEADDLSNLQEDRVIQNPTVCSIEKRFQTSGPRNDDEIISDVKEREQILQHEPLILTETSNECSADVGTKQTSSWKKTDDQATTPRRLDEKEDVPCVSVNDEQVETYVITDDEQTETSDTLDHNRLTCENANDELVGFPKRIDDEPTTTRPRHDSEETVICITIDDDQAVTPLRVDSDQVATCVTIDEQPAFEIIYDEQVAACEVIDDEEVVTCERTDDKYTKPRGGKLNNELAVTSKQLDDEQVLSPKIPDDEQVLLRGRANSPTDVIMTQQESRSDSRKILHEKEQMKSIVSENAALEHIRQSEKNEDLHVLSKSTESVKNVNDDCVADADSVEKVIRPRTEVEELSPHRNNNKDHTKYENRTPCIKKSEDSLTEINVEMMELSEHDKLSVDEKEAVNALVSFRSSQNENRKNRVNEDGETKVLSKTKSRKEKSAERRTSSYEKNAEVISSKVTKENERKIVDRRIEVKSRKETGSLSIEQKSSNYEKIEKISSKVTQKSKQEVIDEEILVLSSTCEPKGEAQNISFEEEKGSDPQDRPQDVSRKNGTDLSSSSDGVARRSEIKPTEVKDKHKLEIKSSGIKSSRPGKIAKYTSKTKENDVKNTTAKKDEPSQDEAKPLENESKCRIVDNNTTEEKSSSLEKNLKVTSSKARENEADPSSQLAVEKIESRIESIVAKKEKSSNSEKNTGAASHKIREKDSNVSFTKSSSSSKVESRSVESKENPQANDLSVEQERSYNDKKNQKVTSRKITENDPDVVPAKNFSRSKDEAKLSERINKHDMDNNGSAQEKSSSQERKEEVTSHKIKGNDTNVSENKNERYSKNKTKLFESRGERSSKYTEVSSRKIKENDSDIFVAKRDKHSEGRTKLLDSENKRMWKEKSSNYDKNAEVTSRKDNENYSDVSSAKNDGYSKDEGKLRVSKNKDKIDNASLERGRSSRYEKKGNDIDVSSKSYQRYRDEAELLDSKNRHRSAEKRRSSSNDQNVENTSRKDKENDIFSTTKSHRYSKDEAERLESKNRYRTTEKRSSSHDKMSEVTSCKVKGNDTNVSKAKSSNYSRDETELRESKNKGRTVEKRRNSSYDKNEEVVSFKDKENDLGETKFKNKSKTDNISAKKERSSSQNNVENTSRQIKDSESSILVSKSNKSSKDEAKHSDSKSNKSKVDDTHVQKGRSSSHGKNVEASSRNLKHYDPHVSTARSDRYSKDETKHQDSNSKLQSGNVGVMEERSSSHEKNQKVISHKIRENPSDISATQSDKHTKDEGKLPENESRPSIEKASLEKKRSSNYEKNVEVTSRSIKENHIDVSSTKPNEYSKDETKHLQIKNERRNDTVSSGRERNSSCEKSVEVTSENKGKDSIPSSDTNCRLASDNAELENKSKYSITAEKENHGQREDKHSSPEKIAEITSCKVRESSRDLSTAKIEKFPKEEAKPPLTENRHKIEAYCPVKNWACPFISKDKDRQPLVNSPAKVESWTFMESSMIGTQLINYEILDQAQSRIRDPVSAISNSTKYVQTSFEKDDIKSQNKSENYSGSMAVNYSEDECTSEILKKSATNTSEHSHTTPVSKVIPEYQSNKYEQKIEISALSQETVKTASNFKKSETFSTKEIEFSTQRNIRSKSFAPKIHQPLSKSLEKIAILRKTEPQNPLSSSTSTATDMTAFSDNYDLITDFDKHEINFDNFHILFDQTWEKFSKIKESTKSKSKSCPKLELCTEEREIKYNAKPPKSESSKEEHHSFDKKVQRSGKVSCDLEKTNIKFRINLKDEKLDLPSEKTIPINAKAESNVKEVSSEVDDNLKLLQNVFGTNKTRYKPSVSQYDRFEVPHKSALKVSPLPSAADNSIYFAENYKIIDVSKIPLPPDRKSVENSRRTGDFYVEDPNVINCKLLPMMGINPTERIEVDTKLDLTDKKVITNTEIDEMHSVKSSQCGEVPVHKSSSLQPSVLKKFGPVIPKSNVPKPELPPQPKVMKNLGPVIPKTPYNKTKEQHHSSIDNREQNLYSNLHKKLKHKRLLEKNRLNQAKESSAGIEDESSKLVPLAKSETSTFDKEVLDTASVESNKTTFPVCSKLSSAEESVQSYLEAQNIPLPFESKESKIEKDMVDFSSVKSQKDKLEKKLNASPKSKTNVHDKKELDMSEQVTSKAKFKTSKKETDKSKKVSSFPKYGSSEQERKSDAHRSESKTMSSSSKSKTSEVPKDSNGFFNELENIPPPKSKTSESKSKSNSLLTEPETALASSQSSTCEREKGKLSLALSESAEALSSESGKILPKKMKVSESATEKVDAARFSSKKSSLSSKLKVSEDAKKRSSTHKEPRKISSTSDSSISNCKAEKLNPDNSKTKNILSSSDSKFCKQLGTNLSHVDSKKDVPFLTSNIFESEGEKPQESSSETEEILLSSKPSMSGYCSVISPLLPKTPEYMGKTYEETLPLQEMQSEMSPLVPKTPGYEIERFEETGILPEMSPALRYKTPNYEEVRFEESLAFQGISTPLRPKTPGYEEERFEETSLLQETSLRPKTPDYEEERFDETTPLSKISPLRPKTPEYEEERLEETSTLQDTSFFLPPKTPGYEEDRPTETSLLEEISSPRPETPKYDIERLEETSPLQEISFPLGPRTPEFEEMRHEITSTLPQISPLGPKTPEYGMEGSDEMSSSQEISPLIPKTPNYDSASVQKILSPQRPETPEYEEIRQEMSFPLGPKTPGYELERPGEVSPFPEIFPPLRPKTPDYVMERHEGTLSLPEISPLRPETPEFEETKPEETSALPGISPLPKPKTPEFEMERPEATLALREISSPLRPETYEYEEQRPEETMLLQEISSLKHNVPEYAQERPAEALPSKLKQLASGEINELELEREFSQEKSSAATSSNAVSVEMKSHIPSGDAQSDSSKLDEATTNRETCVETAETNRSYDAYLKEAEIFDCEIPCESDVAQVVESGVFTVGSNVTDENEDKDETSNSENSEKTENLEWIPNEDYSGEKSLRDSFSSSEIDSVMDLSTVGDKITENFEWTPNDHSVGQETQSESLISPEVDLLNLSKDCKEVGDSAFSFERTPNDYYVRQKTYSDSFGSPEADPQVMNLSRDDEAIHEVASSFDMSTNEGFVDQEAAFDFRVSTQVDPSVMNLSTSGEKTCKVALSSNLTSNEDNARVSPELDPSVMNLSKDGGENCEESNLTTCEDYVGQKSSCDSGVSPEIDTAASKLCENEEETHEAAASSPNQRHTVTKTSNDVFVSPEIFSSAINLSKDPEDNLNQNSSLESSHLGPETSSDLLVSPEMHSSEINQYEEYKNEPNKTVNLESTANQSLVGKTTNSDSFISHEIALSALNLSENREDNSSKTASFESTINPSHVGQETSSDLLLLPNIDSADINSSEDLRDTLEEPVYFESTSKESLADQKTNSDSLISSEVDRITINSHENQEAGRDKTANFELSPNLNHESHETSSDLLVSSETPPSAMNSSEDYENRPDEPLSYYSSPNESLVGQNINNESLVLPEIDSSTINLCSEDHEDNLNAASFESIPNSGQVGHEIRSNLLISPEINSSPTSLIGNGEIESGNNALVVRKSESDKTVSNLESVDKNIEGGTDDDQPIESRTEGKVLERRASNFVEKDLTLSDTSEDSPHAQTSILDVPAEMCSAEPELEISGTAELTDENVPSSEIDIPNKCTSAAKALFEPSVLFPQIPPSMSESICQTLCESVCPDSSDNLGETVDHSLNDETETDALSTVNNQLGFLQNEGDFSDVKSVLDFPESGEKLISFEEGVLDGPLFLNIETEVVISSSIDESAQEEAIEPLALEDRALPSLLVSPTPGKSITETKTPPVRQTRQKESKWKTIFDENYSVAVKSKKRNQKSNTSSNKSSKVGRKRVRIAKNSQKGNQRKTDSNEKLEHEGSSHSLDSGITNFDHPDLTDPSKAADDLIQEVGGSEVAIASDSTKITITDERETVVLNEPTTSTVSDLQAHTQKPLVENAYITQKIDAGESFSTESPGSARAIGGRKAVKKCKSVELAAKSVLIPETGSNRPARSMNYLRLKSSDSENSVSPRYLKGFELDSSNSFIKCYSFLKDNMQFIADPSSCSFAENEMGSPSLTKEIVTTEINDTLDLVAENGEIMDENLATAFCEPQLSCYNDYSINDSFSYEEKQSLANPDIDLLSSEVDSGNIDEETPDGAKGDTGDLKVRLPWKRIFNLKKKQKKKNICSSKGIELGPAKIEVRLNSSESNGSWKVIQNPSVSALSGSNCNLGSPIEIKVNRLVLQRHPTCMNDSNDSKVAETERSLLHDKPEIIPNVIIKKKGTKCYKSYFKFSSKREPVVKLKREKHIDLLALQLKEAAETQAASRITSKLQLSVTQDIVEKQEEESRTTTKKNMSSEYHNTLSHSVATPQSVSADKKSKSVSKAKRMPKLIREVQLDGGLPEFDINSPLCMSTRRKSFEKKKVLEPNKITPQEECSAPHIKPSDSLPRRIAKRSQTNVDHPNSLNESLLSSVDRVTEKGEGLDRTRRRASQSKRRKVEISTTGESNDLESQLSLGQSAPEKQRRDGRTRRRRSVLCGYDLASICSVPPSSSKTDDKELLLSVITPSSDTDNKESSLSVAVSTSETNSQKSKIIGELLSAVAESELGETPNPSCELLPSSSDRVMKKGKAVDSPQEGTASLSKRRKVEVGVNAESSFVDSQPSLQEHVPEEQCEESGNGTGRSELSHYDRSPSLSVTTLPKETDEKKPNSVDESLSTVTMTESPVMQSMETQSSASLQDAGVELQLPAGQHGLKKHPKMSKTGTKKSTKKNRASLPSVTTSSKETGEKELINVENLSATTETEPSETLSTETPPTASVQKAGVELQPSLEPYAPKKRLKVSKKSTKKSASKRYDSASSLSVATVAKETDENKLNNFGDDLADIAITELPETCSMNTPPAASLQDTGVETQASLAQHGSGNRFKVLRSSTRKSVLKRYDYNSLLNVRAPLLSVTTFLSLSSQNIRVDSLPFLRRHVPEILWKGPRSSARRLRSSKLSIPTPPSNADDQEPLPSVVPSPANIDNKISENIDGSMLTSVTKSPETHKVVTPSSASSQDKGVESQSFLWQHIRERWRNLFHTSTRRRRNSASSEYNSAPLLSVATLQSAADVKKPSLPITTALLSDVAPSTETDKTKPLNENLSAATTAEIPALQSIETAVSSEDLDGESQLSFKQHAPVKQRKRLSTSTKRRIRRSASSESDCAPLLSVAILPSKVDYKEPLLSVASAPSEVGDEEALLPIPSPLRGDTEMELTNVDENMLTAAAVPEIQSVEVLPSTSPVAGKVPAKKKKRSISFDSKEQGLYCESRLNCQVCCDPLEKTDSNANILEEVFHCTKCCLEFKSQEEEDAHNSAFHKDSGETQSCLLCRKVFASQLSFDYHLKSRMHQLLAAVQKETIHSLFTHFTGKECPYLEPASSIDLSEFENLTPLQIALKGESAPSQSDKI